MNPEEFKDEFFRAYRGRYSSYWVERWGLIPSIPTSFDNANSVYELLAWLQRAFKQLLDDFVALESELEDYKNALTELLEQLIPLLIRRYMESKEADDWFNKKADIYYNKIIKPYIDAEIAKVNKRIAELEKKVDDEVARLDGRIDALNDKLEKEIKKLDDRITNENNALKERIEALENANAGLQNALRKIIENLEGSGAWTGGFTGGFNQGRNIATGNINLFGGTPDGNSFIRTNNGSTENDLSGGI
nr:MAG TPA: outer capsid protein sigma-1 attachment protein [Caudoviricetes sp.]